MQHIFLEHVTDVSGRYDRYLWYMLQISAEHATDYNGTCARYTAYLHRISAMQKAVRQQRHFDIDAVLVNDILHNTNTIELYDADLTLLICAYIIFK